MDNIREHWEPGQPYASAPEGNKIETVTEFNERNGTA